MLTPDRIGTSAAMGATHGEPGRNGLANHTHNTLLEQFYATLNAMYLNAIESPGGSDGRPLARAGIENLFNDSNRTWQNAYSIELQLTQIMTLPQIDTEWIRRVGEAESLGLPHVANLTKKFSETDDVNIKRAAIQRLINDLQWHYQQRIRRREAAKTLAERVSRIFWIAFATFLWLLFLQLPLSQTKLISTNDQANLGIVK